MKTKQLLFTLLLLLGSTMMWASNDEFEPSHAEGNFIATPKNLGTIHVKTLAWSHGGVCEYDHWASTKDDGTYIYVKRDGEADVRICTYHSGNDDGEDGIAWCRFDTLTYGKFRFTNVNSYGDNDEIHPVHKSSTDNLYIEFDWDLPSELDGTDFSIWVYVTDERFIDHTHHNYCMGSFRGPSPMQAPTLQPAVFYPQDKDGRVQVAKAAVPYATFQTPYWYISNLDPTDTVVVKDMGGMVVVDLADTEVPEYYLTFSLQHALQDNITRELQTNTIKIPAYHKIQNFKVTEWVNPANQRSRGYNCLSWEVHNAGHADIYAGDRFLIERASKSDFSDAAQVATVDMATWEENIPKDTTILYTYVDSAFNARRTVHPDSTYWYYRVSRATASLWPEDTVYHKYARLEKKVHLPALVDEQPQIDTLPTYSRDYAVRIHAILLGEDLPNGLNSCWDEGAQLILHRTTRDKNSLTALTQQIPFEADSIYQDPNNPRLWHAYYVDHVGQPCSEYTYSVTIQTKSAQLYLPKQGYSATIGGNAYTVNPQKSVDGVTLTDDMGNFAHSELPQIEGFAASQGDFANRILVRWNAVQGSRVSYRLERKHLKDNAWSTIGTTPTLVSPFSDTDVTPGGEFQYRLSVMSICGTDTFLTADTCVGVASIYGHISGYVRLGDGTAEAGTCVSAMIGSDTIATVYTNEKGYYIIDSIDCTDPKKLSIMPISRYSSYAYGTSSDGVATISMGPSDPYFEQINFTNKGTVRFSGRVLYDNSTVPVANAYFRVNGAIVHDRSGNVIKTETDGSFVFSIPSLTPLTIQTEKAGHTFDNNGFFQMESLTEAGVMTDTLNFSKNVDGRRMHDMTRTVLRGRIAGGRVQGDMPLGQYLSTNNLGDNLNFVLELEGDNISHLVHSTDNTLHEIDKVYTDSTADGVVHSTHMHMTESRITITVDSATGEFRAEVIPTRYKVVQMNAQGYATLFNNGQTSFSLDLSEAKDTADFVHIYHSPINVELKQFEYGMIEQPFFGIDKVRQQDAAGKMTILPLLTVSGDTVEYAFGYPVFSEGEYFIRVSAHEDYYYNNNRHGEHDLVMLGNHDVKVFNGFDSETKEIITHLDTTGTTMVRVRAANTTFSLTDEQALKSFSVSVLVDGDYVESANLQAFVTGSRLKENTFETDLGTSIHLDDIIRDPYGANSYAYLESGTTFNASFSSSWDIKGGVDMTIGTGENFYNITGTANVALTATAVNVSQLYSVNIPLINKWHMTEHYTYSRTISDRVSTSSDPYQVGAKADVFTGTELVRTMKYQEAFRIMNDSMYHALAPVFAAGRAHLIRQGQVVSGKDTTRYYLVTGDEAVPGVQVKANFAYTQRHIVETILPNLFQNRNALLIQGDSTTAQNLANSTQKEVYLSLVPVDDEHFACECDSSKSGKTFYYKVYYPNNATVKPNRVADYNNMIAQWMSFVIKNESLKMGSRLSGNRNLLGTYDLSTNVTVSHSENTSWGTSSSHTSEFFTGGGGGVTATVTEGVSALIKTIVKALDFSPKNNNLNETKVPGFGFVFKLNPVLDWNHSMDNPMGNSSSRTVGFVLDAGDGNYLSQNVYRILNDSMSRVIIDAGNPYWDKMNSDEENTDRANYLNSFDFVYSLNGGATHCPYIGADSAICFSGQVLSEATLRIDNPMMSLDKHLVSNVPDGQPAVFVLTMVNETEVNPNTYTSATPNTFSLFQPAGSNQHGATIMMDGMPITDGRIFALNPGDRTTKRLEVYRGQGYDFEDIELVLRNTCDANNLTKIKLAVHYIPSSCDVKISSPTDKWVMNTLSPRDTIGYYIPVVIDGFDTNWENFDHIEFQYKLTTDPDEKWVNQCSYYADPERMAECSGNHALIESGRIDNIRFYGERDPMEQQYDLRAVSFTRHGTSFITKSSPVLTGIKDTRPPQIFGLPTPADQILHFDQFISIPFSEPIAGNYLDEDNNFSMLAFTNSSSITDGTSLDFSGSADAYALSSAGRTLNKKSFTIDMMVRPNQQKQAQTLFSHGTSNHAIHFGLNDRGCLVAQIGTQEYESEDPGIINSFVRLLMVYNQEDSTLHFYMGNHELRIVSRYGNSCVVESERSPFCLGANYDDGEASNNFAGRMMEVRVWNEALTPARMSETDMRRLTGYEEGLVAYYPLNEGRYDQAKDLANGAHLKLHSLAWSNPDGMSIHLTADDLEGKGIHLREDVLSRDEHQDMTLSFWFRCDKDPVDKDTMALYATGLGDTTEILADQHLFIGLMGKRLMVRHNGNVLDAGMVTDADWHRFALTISRANNVGHIYLDGKMVSQFNAHLIGAVSDAAYLGACHYFTYDEDYNRVHNVRYPFSGYFDQFQLWEQALSPEFQERFAEGAPTGTEMGLLVYLPMHRLVESEQGEMLLVYSPYNAVIPAGQNEPSKDTIILSDASSLVTKTEYAPVRANDKLSKLRFSWVARSTDLVVNLNMQDAELNKNTVYMTIRDVKDLNGNPMVSPLSWNIYMDRNRLRWSERTMDVELPYGKDTTITVNVNNLCGVYSGYTLSSMAAWIRPVTPQGYLSAADEQRVSLYISSSLDPGEYSTYVYLTDQNGLAEPLTVNLRVFTRMPADWEVHTDKGYNSTMSLVGQIIINDDGDPYFDTSEDDVVAAFVGNQCVGVQKNSFRNDYSAVYLTIHGNDAIAGQPIEFRLWRARTGRIYELTPSVVDITYLPNACYGCDSPIILRTKVANAIQTLSLEEGWNWISFNLSLPVGASLNEVFASGENLSSGDMIKSMFGSYMSDYSTSYALPQWIVANTNSQEYLTHKQAYMYRSATGGDILVRGTTLEDQERCLMLDTAWNSLSYLCSVTQSVTDAMAQYLDDALPGEIIKSYSQFAVYTTDNGWVGSLEYMRPGEGYMMYRKGKTPVKFCFVNNGQPSHGGRAQAPSRSFKSATCMPMVLTIEGITLQPGDQLMVINQNHGEPASEMADAQPATNEIYMVAHADEGDVLSFALVRDGEIVAQSTTRVSYTSASIVGAVHAPKAVHFDEPTTRKIIRDDQLLILRQDEVFNALGTKLQ